MVNFVMGDVLSSVSSVVTASIGWIGEYVSVITSTPLLLLFTTIPLVGLGIGLLRRLLSV